MVILRFASYRPESQHVLVILRKIFFEIMFWVKLNSIEKQKYINERNEIRRVAINLMYFLILSMHLC